MASHLSWFANFLFLLLILAQTPSTHTRPARATSSSELIAGNDFLKLFLEHDETQRELHSDEHDESGRVLRGTTAQKSSDSSSSTSRSRASERRAMRANNYESTADANTQSNGQEKSNGGARQRSLQHKSHHTQQNEASTTATVPTTTTAKAMAERRKQVVKVVKSVKPANRIIFPEEYNNDNDAIIDTKARDIDLKKEKAHAHSHQLVNKQSAAQKQTLMQYESNSSDEIKVITVSVSTSSKRGGYIHTSNHHQYNNNNGDTAMSKQGNKLKTSQSTVQQSDDSGLLAMKLTLTTTPPTAPMTVSDSATMDDFVNRSHKSEFSIEEVEPLTMSPQKQRAAKNPQAARVNSPRSLQMPHAVSGRAAKTSNLDDGDSENSASTNIQNVLAAPLQQAASMRTASINVPAGFHSHNVTSTHINHQHSSAVTSHASAHISAAMTNDADMLDTSALGAAATIDVDEKLLPFQTVIYHNTKEGHGPQSRSISYSSLSQNVDDLQKWRLTSILAEAQRNVSESLKPIPRVQLTHNSEPAKFYSVPSKMYSEPSKFYSEPAKAYGEPAKVYGMPEKVYSEPAKVYGQPSKFYSEPAKVYSQPAKVYSEPAKTYWSPSTANTTNTSSTSTTTAKTPTHATQTTTVRPVGSGGGFMPSRRPAIVSRIAFGEAQTSTSAPRAIEEHAAATMTAVIQQQQKHQQFNTRFQPHPYVAQSHSHNSNDDSPPAHTHTHSTLNPSQPTQSQSQSHLTQSQPRRVLFNLDKLPYDLLNAPAQSSQHLLDPDFSHSPPAAVTYSSPRQRQCLESAFSVSQHQRQHSSLSEQHSNQNTKGLPNRDLVKCVSIYNQPSAVTSTATTESGHNGNDDDDNNDNKNNDDLYKPTPEQNYEIEESVSVMTNGRADGVQDNSAATTTATPYAMRSTKYPNRGGIHHQQHQQQHYYNNANTNVNTDNNNYDDNFANIDGDPSGFDGGSDGEAVTADDEGIDADGNISGNDEKDAKVAYVVEGRNYRKYRVEEKTDDGFIVGEYGVVDHNDGNLRGVRYTADSTINRSLIQKALLTFLKLK
ncbi:uncharacterized protein [Eurosta solidaginis]|uniref:uncharacterized protein n=1 Tax=Eurosta solidaginis TaxID=178769 RepID=UPI003531237F